MEHAAVGLVGIRLRRIVPNRGAAQPVTVLGRFDQAGFVVGVAARPIAIGCLMAELLEVTDRIIFIEIAVVSHRLAVAGMPEADAKLVVPRRFWLSHLPDVLPSRGSDQPVGSVVSVIVARRNYLAIEIDGL